MIIVEKQIHIQYFQIIKTDKFAYEIVSVKRKVKN